MTHQRKPDGKRQKTERHVLMGGIPWPELGDGTPFTDHLERVRLTPRPEEVGKLQWVEWCHPDGERMADGDRVKKATKTKAEEARPGAWWAVVAWDGRDDSREEPVLARHPLANLTME